MDKIQEYKIGSFIIEGRQFIGNVKIVEGKVRYWERPESQSLATKDLLEMINQGPEFLLIGTGAAGLLKVPEYIKQEAAGKGISLFIGKTQDMVKKFNDLNAQKKKVNAILCAGS
ncbi:MAG: MTH938/NDUFAF3 family protein [Nanoarchaeota archaeon]